MEKISSILRSSPRVASVDLKSSSAVRPGVPSFGRTVGESPTTGLDRDGTTTASRAAALHAELSDRRSGGPERVIDQMANQFFVNRVQAPKAGAIESVEPKVAAAEVEEIDDDSVQLQSEQVAQPSGYTPRGSFVDVRV